MSVMSTIPYFAGSGAALIASPSSAVRDEILHRIAGRCRPVHQVSGGADALAKLESGNWQLLFLDRKLPDLDAEEVLARIQKRFPRTEVVMLNSENKAEPEQKSAVRESSRTEVNRLEGITTGQASRARPEPLPDMIGGSEAMCHVYRLIRLVAPRSTTVLVTGPTGTGKELVARGLHALSPRSGKPLVTVNCAAIPETLLESELFGYVRGAFTGAIQSQIGRIPAAHGGTLFLDEISELPLGMQAKLLRFLEQKEIQRLGSTEVIRVDARIVAASNVDLSERVREGRFRQDLFFRLSTFPVDLPPLSKRRGDILPLAEHFLKRMASALDIATPHLSQEAIELLEHQSWEGNVRELQHVMERASILVEGRDTILPEHLYFPYAQPIGMS